jgi:hypothetical protein
MDAGKYKFRDVFPAALEGALSPDGFYLFFSELEGLSENSDIFLGEIDVNDQDEEVYDDEIKSAGFNTFINAEILEDVIQNVSEKSSDKSDKYVVKAFLYYVDNDTLLV